MSDNSEKIDQWKSAGSLSESASKNLKQWLSDSAYKAFHGDIHSLIEAGNLDELEDAFRVKIAFGTGGIRGKMGSGPNRINLRTIGEAAQGLSQYVLKAGGPSAAANGLAIAFDTRNNSDVYAREVASIAAGPSSRTFPRASPRHWV